MLSLYTVRKTRHALAAKAATDDVCVPTYYNNNFIAESAVLLYYYTRVYTYTSMYGYGTFVSVISRRGLFLLLSRSSSSSSLYHIVPKRAHSYRYNNNNNLMSHYSVSTAPRTTRATQTKYLSLKTDNKIMFHSCCRSTSHRISISRRHELLLYRFPRRIRNV